MYRVMQLTDKSAYEVLRMDPSEFTLNLIVADVGIHEERNSFFETLASLLSSFMKAIFGRR